MESEMVASPDELGSVDRPDRRDDLRDDRRGTTMKGIS
jgi:hypothetical protein